MSSTCCSMAPTSNSPRQSRGASRMRQGPEASSQVQTLRLPVAFFPV